MGWDGMGCQALPINALPPFDDCSNKITTKQLATSKVTRARLLCCKPRHTQPHRAHQKRITLCRTRIALEIIASRASPLRAQLPYLSDTPAPAPAPIYRGGEAKAPCVGCVAGRWGELPAGGRLQTDSGQVPGPVCGVDLGRPR
jgi:hypothetical protein